MSYDYQRNSNYNFDIRAQQKDQPLDTVNCLVWDQYRIEDLGFLSASWDGYIRYYQIQGRRTEELVKTWQRFLQHPVLCCDLNPDMLVFVGLANGDIVVLNMRNNDIAVLGNHNAPICGLFWVRQINILLTAGYDDFLRFWTLENTNGSFMQMEYKLPQKTFTVSLDYPYLLIGSYQSCIMVQNLKDLPNLNIPRQYKSVGLQFFSKFNCSKILASHKRIILGTVDGRTSIIEFRDYNGITFENPLVSKSQKKEQGRRPIYGQVNSVDIGVHSYEIYALIAGSDDVSIYNLFKKLKCKSIKCNPSYAISTARINPDGKYIVYASGTDWEEGLYELQNIKKPQLVAIKLTSGELSSFVVK